MEVGAGGWEGGWWGERGGGTHAESLIQPNVVDVKRLEKKKSIRTHTVGIGRFDLI